MGTSAVADLPCRPAATRPVGAVAPHAAHGADPACIAAIRDGLIAEHLGVAPKIVTARIAETGSLTATIEGLRNAGRSLVRYEVPDISAVEAWLADNEVLDPEGPAEMFESISQRGLFRRLRPWRKRSK